MAAKIEIDCREIAQDLRRNALIRGVNVFGNVYRPNQWLASGANFYQAPRSGLISHAFNFQVRQPHQISYVRGDWLTVVFMVQGSLTYSCAAGSALRVSAGTIAISASPWSATPFDQGLRLFAGFMVWVERRNLIDVFGLQVDNIPELYRPIFASGAEAILDIELPMPASAWAAVQETLQCGYPEPLRAEYQNAKAVELICYAVAELNKLRPDMSRIGVFRETRERAGIEIAANIYRYEISDPPSLNEVARRVGMNRNKLVGGFREQFGVTPGDYSRRVRLDRAQEMLRGDALSIEQIAVACGYTSHAAFTRSFRQRYGFSPSKAGALDSQEDAAISRAPSADNLGRTRTPPGRLFPSPRRP